MHVLVCINKYQNYSSVLPQSWRFQAADGTSVTLMATLSPEFNVLLISSCMQFRLVNVVPKQMNFATFSKYLIALMTSQLCPVFWWRDMNTHITICSFISRPASSLSNKAHSIVLFKVLKLPANKLTQSCADVNAWSYTSTPPHIPSWCAQWQISLHLQLITKQNKSCIPYPSYATTCKKPK